TLFQRAATRPDPRRSEFKSRMLVFFLHPVKTLPGDRKPVGGRAAMLVLASTSPYRRELLARLGLTFTVCSPGVDEAPWPDETPADTAVRLAQAKARAGAARYPRAGAIGSGHVPQQ